MSVRHRASQARSWEVEDVELVERAWAADAREDFYAFRIWNDPTIKDGWWQREVAKHLMQFRLDWKAGKRPILALQAPPQHGKSKQITDFIAWCAGHDPSQNTIYGSYSEDLGVKANMYLQRMFESDKYRRCFPSTRINDANAVTMSGRWLRNSSMLEYVGQKGSFRNVTVGGQVTGMSCDLGVIDDPIKGRAEASSITIREKTWNWFTDDFMTRFSDLGALLIIMTRWHLDDPLGRLAIRNPNVKFLRYPALAEKDDAFRKKGEPLFPQLKSLEFLQDKKNTFTQAGWESVYQQNPIVVGGDMFPIEKIEIVKVMPHRKEIKRSIRYWDKAGTEAKAGTKGGAATAGVLMHELHSGKFLIENVVRGHWSALAREQRIKLAAQLDDSEGRRTEVWIEQEPGSGGKESAESTIRNLKGHRVYSDRVTGKKEVRAEPYAAQFQAGNIAILEAPWNRNFLDEHELFPNGKFKDQVDAAGGAFGKLTIRDVRYDTSMNWVKARHPQGPRELRA